MREYLLKGGFLMVDDFHGTAGLGELHDRDAADLSGAAKYPVEDLNGQG